MNAIPRDFLVTYDPGYLEEHSDSSEFEDSIPSITPKGSNQFLLTRQNIKKATKKQKDYLNRKVANRIFTNHDYKRQEYSNLEEKTVQTSTMFHLGNVNVEMAGRYENRNFNKGDQINYKQKENLLRHKIIPCLSSMFGRSNKKISTKENQVKNVSKDNSCQAEYTNSDRQRKNKLNRRQNYTMQPIYALEGVMHGALPLNIGENTQMLPSDNNKSLRRVYSNIFCNVALSEDESEALEKVKRRKRKKRLQAELKEGILKYKSNIHRKHHRQQFPSKQSLYQVFAPAQDQYNVAKTKSQKNYNSLHSGWSSTSSGFWDYILDKFNKKYHTKNPDPPKQGQYEDFATQCCVNFDNCGSYIEAMRQQKASRNVPDDDCPCSDINLRNPRNYGRDFTNNFDAPRPDLEKRKTSASKYTQCECHPVKRKQSTAAKHSPSSIDIPENICTCQQPHDLIAESLANKYNGEILCIHNPPCILINGCLNLTQPKEVSPVNAWPVIETKKESFFRGCKKAKNSKKEQFSQYHAQCVEVRQCQTPENKTEKVIQSVCNHNPPCEVVRCCYKHKYNPKLQNYCVHVPMCQKIPECMMQRRDNKTIGLCKHTPKCLDLPTCTRKYVTLTARDSIGTQVKPQTKMLCRHNPPCVLIPKCLGGAVQETYISYEAIPNCVHQPLCDLIPACCRKSTKGMVSTCSQYPNGCRVV